MGDPARRTKATVKSSQQSSSESRLRVLIKAIGYRYHRPKYDLGHLQDQEAKTQAAALLDELKKRPLRQASSSS